MIVGVIRSCCRFVTHLYDMTRLYDYDAAHDSGGDPLMLQVRDSFV